ncbi:hypothetical protein LINPERPRIM_LOCUS13931, partial [Linum perenne]
KSLYYPLYIPFSELNSHSQVRLYWLSFPSPLSQHFTLNFASSNGGFMSPDDRRSRSFTNCGPPAIRRQGKQRHPHPKNGDLVNIAMMKIVVLWRLMKCTLMSD